MFRSRSYVDPPAAAVYYMHHPLGMFWMVEMLGKVFGLHDWVLRLPPLVYVTATTCLLLRIGRELWGAIPGGLTALAYVALPITLGYANYHDLEQPVMFGIVLSSWGYLRFIRTWRERYAIASVLGFVFALNNDWAAYLWGAFFLAGLFVYGFLLPERMRGGRAAPFGRYWALMCVGVAVSFAVELVLAERERADLGRAVVYFVRSAGSEAPLEVVLAARRYRIELMFTALGIGLGKLALPVIVARAVIRRDHLELLPLPIFFCALLQYRLQAGGRRSHLLAALLRAVLRAGDRRAGGVGLRARAWLGARRGGAMRAASAGRALGGAGCWGCRWLRPQGRSVAGAPGARDRRALRRGEHGHRSRQGAVLRWFLARYPPTVGVAYHASIHDDWALQWELRPRLATASQPVVAAGGEQHARLHHGHAERRRPADMM